MLKRRGSGLWDDKVDKITLRDGFFRSPVPGLNQGLDARTNAVPQRLRLEL
jgi:hypothetical protein